MRRDQQLVHPKFQPYFNKFIQDCVTDSLRCFIAKQNLEIIYYETIAQTTCKKLTKKVAQKKKVITVENVCVKVIKNVKTEFKKVRRTLE